MVLQFPLEETVRNNILSKNIPVGTLFITVIARGTYFMARISM
jgi:hypothetical protein